MTRIRINGRIILLLSVILFSFSSCFNKQLYSGNIYHYNYSYYLNDSIHFSVKLAGDFIQNKKIKKLKSKLKTYSNRPFKNKFLAFFETKIDPKFDVFLLYFKNRIDLKSFLSYKKIETVNYSNGRKEVEIRDSLKYIYGKAIMNKDSAYVLLLAYARAKNISDYRLLVEEESDAFNTMNFTKKYRAIIPGPFKMGADNSLNDDKSINYLMPIVQLKAHAKMYGEDNFMFLQAICTYASRISNSKVFDLYFHKYLKKSLHFEIPNDEYLAKNDIAINAIKNSCSNTNLVMFNENHFNVKDRKLVRFLLKYFYQEGYRYLGLEALSENSKSLNDRGYPLISSGFYTREPEMGNLIRKACKMGFYVFGYDSLSGNRELNQAKNIYHRTFERDPKAKVIILGGFDHILEKEDKYSKKWMAYYFHELYGINPVTFSQTILKPNKKIWLGLVKNDSISRKSTDYLISNNISDSIFTNETEKTFSVDLPKSKFNKEYIVSIFLKNEYEETKNCIPVKNVIITNSENLVKVVLEKGKYLYTVRNTRGYLISKSNLIIE